MSFGSSAPKPPAAQPVTPVPQPDSPDLIDTKRREAIRASQQDGVSAHLLTGTSGEGIGEDATTDKKRLTPNLMQ